MAFALFVDNETQSSRHGNITSNFTVKALIEAFDCEMVFWQSSISPQDESLSFWMCDYNQFAIIEGYWDGSIKCVVHWGGAHVRDVLFDIAVDAGLIVEPVFFELCGTADTLA